MPSPLLPKELELPIDLGETLTSQIRAALEKLRPRYAWFLALSDPQLDRLASRLVDLAAPKVQLHTARVGALVDSGLATAEMAAPMLAGTTLQFSLDELQQCCEELLPVAALRALLLEELDIHHIFGDSGEETRLAKYAALTKSSFTRSREVSRFDPDGKLFVIDLPDLLGVPWASVNELDFSALGCHGTCAASFSNLEAANQLPNIVWRGIAGKQKSVGDEVVRWHQAMKAKGKRSFGFILGDNFYESGIPRTEPARVDELFQKAFVDVYNSIPGRGGSRPLGVQYFGLLGNHDYNFHGHAAVPGDGSVFADNLDRAIAQIDYGYRHAATSGWQMPYRYYCAVSPVANFFVIDSTTFLFDKRQQAWLRTVYEKLATTRRWSFLMAHHGYVTFGKRGSGHHAEKELGKLAQTAHTSRARREIDRGGTGATEAKALGVAATDLRDNVNRHIFTWFAREGMHFHFNVVAHDHFLASAMLTYDVAGGGGGLRRTYYVLSGGGGATPGGGNLDTLVRNGPNCANIDMLESKFGFATFKVSRDSAELNFRFVDGSRAADAWGAGEEVLALSDDTLWRPATLASEHKRLAQPTLRGVFYKRGEGGLLHSAAYQRRYFETSWASGTFRYAEKPGKVGRSGNEIDLRQMDPGSRSWANGAAATVVTVKGVEGLYELTFRTTRPARTWVFAVPPDVYPDMTAWLDSSIPTRPRR